MSLKERVNYGWIPDLPDFRDRLAFSKARLADSAPLLPSHVDLRARHMFTVLDQGDIGSCVAHAVSSAIEFAQRTRPLNSSVSAFLAKLRIFQTSRLFLYYEARRAIGLLHEDSGCHIRDAMRVAYNMGVPRESGWRYVTSKFNVAPPQRQYKSAPFHKITSYQSVDVSTRQVKLALAEGRPVVFGVSLFDSFFRFDDGTIFMPADSDTYLGGHAMLLVGYDDATERFTVLNSWGKEYGM